MTHKLARLSLFEEQSFTVIDFVHPSLIGKLYDTGASL